MGCSFWYFNSRVFFYGYCELLCGFWNCLIVLKVCDVNGKCLFYRVVDVKVLSMRWVYK